MSSAIPTGIVSLKIRIMRYPIKGSIKNWQNRPIHIPFQFRNCLRISRMSTVLAIPITKKKRRRCVTTVAQIIISDVVFEDKIMCLLECSRAMKACVVDFYSMLLSRVFAVWYYELVALVSSRYIVPKVSCILGIQASDKWVLELNGKGTVHFASSCYIAACVVVVGCFKTSSSYSSTYIS
jgi:hypothetical protein